MRGAGVWRIVWLLGLLRPALAGPWMVPDWQGHEPSFPPGSLFWRTREFPNCPILYRTVLEAKPGQYELRCEARLAGDAWIYLNGELIGRPARANGAPADQVHRVSVLGRVHPGKNVLVVSTSLAGLAVDALLVSQPAVAGVEARDERVAGDPAAWRVQKLPPLTMVDFEPSLKSEYDASAWFAAKVGDGEALAAADPELLQPPTMSGRPDAVVSDGDAAWMLAMLAAKGIAIVGWEARGFGGTGRLPGWLLQAAQTDPAALPEAQGLPSLALSLSRYVRLADEVANRTNQATGLAALGASRTEAAACLAGLDAAQASLARAAVCFQHLDDKPQPLPVAPEPLDPGATRDERRAYDAQLRGYQAELEAWKQHYNPGLPGAEKAVDDAAGALAKPLPRRLNPLDTCLDNKFGWIDNNDLIGNDLAAWGLRVNPVAVSWKLALDGKWRFQTDPDNTGLAEARQSFGYNLENQWPELTVPGSWESQGVQQDNPKAVDQSPYPGVNRRTDGPYNGFAWYRKTLRVPAEWAGYDLELFCARADDWDWGYFNGTEVGHTGADTANYWQVERHYKVPKELVHFGGVNVIAFRLYDCGGEGGLMGSVELRCPGLQQAFEQRSAPERRPTTVYASPLSPAALLTVGDQELTLWGWEQRNVPGPNAVQYVRGGKLTQLAPSTDGTVYEQARDGELSENWLLLTSPGDDPPIELVMLQRPARIVFHRTGRGTSSVVVAFAEPGARVLALRPVANGADDTLTRCRFWSRALLRYPTTFSEASVKDPKDPWALRVADVYNYRDLKDAWGTQPLTFAPLPPLACYGLETGYPGLTVETKVDDTGCALGPWGSLRAAAGTDTIVWRVPMDPIPRYGGFTAFCFGPTDIGGPGNLKELETIQRAGANSYRPQHNQNGERAMQLVHWCVERGIQQVFNVDNQYAAKDTIFEHYRTLAEQCQDLPPWAVVYDLINEPANMTPEVYNPRVKKLTEIIRAVDQTHLIYVETPHSYASVSEFPHLEPTGDKLTVYSFHDYDYRLPPRWPNENQDMRNVLAHWLPAIKFSIDHRCAISLGEFGGFEQTKQSVYDNPCAMTVLFDFFRAFDQFGWHFHYYANRGTVRVRSDGALEDSYVQEAYRRYFAWGTFNANRPPDR